jgi:hypothetical protein
MAIVRVLVAGVILMLPISSCVIQECCGPIPEDSVELVVTLEPGSTREYVFDVEAEALSQPSLEFSVRTTMSPVPHALPEGILARRWLTRNGTTENDWPEHFETEVGERSTVATLTVELENSGTTTVEFPLVVRVRERGDIAGPGEDDLILAIRQR